MMRVRDSILGIFLVVTAVATVPTVMKAAGLPTGAAGCGAANAVPVTVDTAKLAACVEGDLEKGLGVDAIIQDCGPAAAADIIALITTFQKAQRAPAFHVVLDAGRD